MNTIGEFEYMLLMDYDEQKQTLTDYFNVVAELKAFYRPTSYHNICDIDRDDEWDILTNELERCVNLLLNLEEHITSLKRYIESYLLFVKQTNIPDDIINIIFSFLPY